MNVKSIKNHLSAHGLDGEMIFLIITGVTLLSSMVLLAIMTWFYPYPLDTRIIMSVFGAGALVALFYFCKVVIQERRDYLARRKITRKVSLTKV